MKLSVKIKGLVLFLAVVYCFSFVLFSQGKKGGMDLRSTGKNYNILLITVDTLRYDRLSIYDSRYVRTPNIDRLGQRSFVFKRAFTHNPCTLPAHTNILTGTTALYHGISDNSGFHLESRFLTFAEYAKQSGYSTGAFIGAFPLDSRFGLNQGFDVYDDNYGTHNQLELFFVERSADKVIAPAIKWISSQRGKWFTWIHIFDPHQPYLPPAPFRKEYASDPYSGEVAYVDSCLKTLFDFLESRKALENTIIVLTGDHGEALGEKGEDTHSYFAYNNTIHIPLIVYIPGGRGGFINGNVCHTDIFPTLCDITGMKIPSQIQGESLLPLIDGNKRKHRDIYFESLSPYLNRGWAPLRGFIRDDSKYIDLPIPEVYDLKTDLNEDHNIATGSNIGQMKRDLIKLKLDLKGPAAVERSAKIDSDISNKLKSLGYVSSTTRELPKTFTAADDLKTLLPLQKKLWEAVGKFQNGQFKDSVAGLKEIIDQSPGFILAYRYLAQIYKDFGQIDNAVSILENGLKKNPGSVSLMSKLGIILAESNNPGKAIELLTYCIQKDPFDPENFNYIGAAYFKKGIFDLALENYKKALQLDTNYASVYNNIGTLYLTSFLKKKDSSAFSKALENFNRAVTLDPRLFAAYNGLGAAYKFNSDPDRAILQWQKVLEIKSDFIDAYFNIAVTALEKGDKAMALKYLNECKEKFFNRLSVGDRRRLDNLITEAGKVK